MVFGLSLGPGLALSSPVVQAVPVLTFELSGVVNSSSLHLWQLMLDQLQKHSFFRWCSCRWNWCIYDYIFLHYIFTYSKCKYNENRQYNYLVNVHVHIFSNGNIPPARVTIIPHLVVLFVESPVLWKPDMRAVPQELGQTLFLRCFTFVIVRFTTVPNQGRLKPTCWPEKQIQ